MRRVFSVAIMLVCLFTALLFMAPAYAGTESGRIDNLFSWSLDEEGVLKIEGYGLMPDFSSSNAAPWNGLVSQIKKVELGADVRSIGAEAFTGCSELTEVSLPDGLIKVGSYAFFQCTKLAEIELPEGLKEIGGYAFSYTQITELDIPDSVEKMANEAIAYCSKLEELHLPAALTRMETWLVEGAGIRELTVPENVRTIGSYVANSCWNLTVVRLPKSVENINMQAFEGNGKTWDVYYEGTQAEAAQILIGTRNDGVLNAVWHCADGDGSYPTFTSGVIGTVLDWTYDAGVLTIRGTGAIPAFDGSERIHPWHQYISSIEKVVIEEGITSIGQNDFSYHERLEEVVLPETLKYIGQRRIIEHKTIRN